MYMSWSIKQIIREANGEQPWMMYWTDAREASCTASKQQNLASTINSVVLVKRGRRNGNKSGSFSKPRHKNRAAKHIDFPQGSIV